MMAWIMILAVEMEKLTDLRTIYEVELIGFGI